MKRRLEKKKMVWHVEKERKHKKREKNTTKSKRDKVGKPQWNFEFYNLCRKGL